MLAVQVDSSRNAVMNVASLKKFASLIKKMGYDTLMLYIEDTYEVDNQPAFGYLRGRYTQEELKEIDEYCASIGIELIPCMQTLAHLKSIFKWYTEYRDIWDYDDVLLIGEEKTYKLIDDMFASLSKCIKSKKIHIGMDEAAMVGLGQYRQKHGIEDRFDLFNKHLHKVCEIADKYGYEPMIWSDMLCNLALNTELYYDNDNDIEKIKEKAKLPENVTLFYWDYCSKDYERYDKLLKLNKAFGNKVSFAGAAWSWNGLVPNNQFSIETTNAALRACKDNGIEDVLITTWGDNGGQCSRFSVLPALMYAAEFYNGNSDMDSIKKKFYDIVGMDFDAFMMLDNADLPGGKHDFEANRYLLYNDLFIGLNDHRITDADEKFYCELSKKLSQIEVKGEYSYVFDSILKLCELLAVKVNLGNKTRNAYKEGDKEALKNLLADYDLVLERLEKYHYALQKQWFTENKTFGFDVQEIRHGGMLLRIKDLKQRLIDYIDGKADSIPELEEEIKEFLCGSHWEVCVTPSVI